jgi:hypothetical protein
MVVSTFTFVFLGNDRGLVGEVQAKPRIFVFAKTRITKRRVERSSFRLRKGEIRTRRLLAVKFRQPSHEFTFGVDMSFILYPLVLTPLV